MQTHFGVDLLRAEWPSAVVCIGTFDGVHLGHQAVIGEAIRKARINDQPAILVTFDRHPAHILAPEKCPKAIASLGDNLESFQRLEVAVAVILSFDYALSQTSADDFLREIIKGKLKATSLVVGHDFAFGHGRQGTPAWLQDKIDTSVVAPFEIEGLRVSSSAIRDAVSSGDVQKAARLLGRPFAIDGVVVSGEKLGRTLGYPTANLARSFDQVVPADGIYAGFCRTPFGSYPAAISIGMRPTVSGRNRTIEAFLLDYPGHSLYGADVRLSVSHRLREERAYVSLEALKKQMEKDVAEVAQLYTKQTL